MYPKIQYIEKKRNKYWFVRAIPKAHKDNPFFAGYGTNYTKNLQTDSLSVAIARRDQVLARWEQATSGNPRDIYQITKEATKEFDFAGSLNAEDNAYSLSMDELLMSWERRFQRDPETGQFIEPIPENERVMYRAYADAKKEVTTNRAVPNPYPMSLTEATNKTLEFKKADGVTPKGLQKYSRTTRFFIEYYEAEVAISDITRLDVIGFINNRRLLKKTDKTIKGYLTNLSQIWSTARDLGEVPESNSNPFLEHGLKNDSIKRDLLQINQVKQILCDDLSHEERLLYLMGYYTGARAQELLGLTNKSIVERDGDNGRSIRCLHIAPKTKENRRGGKTANATRFIPIHSELEPFLENFTGFSINYSHFDKKRRKLFVKLFGEESKGVIVFHSLRHTFITRVTNATGNTILTQELAGHSKSSSGITMTYFHGSGLEKLKEAVETIPKI